MGITDTKVSYNDIKIGDWIALKEEEAVPMKVMMKYESDDLVTLSIDYKGSAVKKLKKEEFNKADYYKFEKN